MSDISYIEVNLNTRLFDKKGNHLYLRILLIYAVAKGSVLALNLEVIVPALLPIFCKPQHSLFKANVLSTTLVYRTPALPRLHPTL